MKGRNRSNERKEIRGDALVTTIHAKLPHVGHVKIDTRSKGRKATAIFRGLHYVISSRLSVREMGLVWGRDVETADALALQSRLRA